MDSHGKIIQRSFIQTAPQVGKGELQPESTLSTFFEHHGLAILGEPGLGKTEALFRASQEEPDSIFVPIGEFLSALDLTTYEDKAIYLDGLDEHRSRSQGEDVIDAIIAKLRQLNSPKFRISCRTAEWHGGKDLTQLSAVTGGKSVIQLELQPLTEIDVLTLFHKNEGFIQGARANHLDEFLKNPQDAQLLYAFYKENNSWPDNRSDLMEGACKVLLQENNTKHRHVVDDWVTDQELDDSANYLSAILMMSQLLGISSTRSSSDKNYPCIQAFGGDNLFALKAATNRNVFRSLHNHRIVPKHRKISEYMAGRYLASRIREGVPLSRVMALITGHDGGIAPDLRGLYAWLVSLLGGMAELVLKHDPYGAIIYGDPYSWTPNVKRTALKCLQQHAQKDPWFRGQDWSGEALGGLSCIELKRDFSKILKEDKCDSHLVSAVLDSIASGHQLEEMGDDLLAFIKDPDKPEHLKGSAIHALYKAVPSKRSELVNLFSLIRSGDIKDEDQYLWGALLSSLYPDNITPSEITHYLIPPTPNLIGSYHMFMNYEIFDRTDMEGFIAIARSINQLEPQIDDDYDDKRFNGSLIQKLLEGYEGEQGIPEIYEWLALGISEHGMIKIGIEGEDAVHSFFDRHPEVYSQLFWYYFEEKWDKTKNKKQNICWVRFRQLTASAIPPSDFVDNLLRYIDSQTDMQNQKVIFDIACLQALYNSISYPDTYLDQLSSIADKYDELSEIYSKYTTCEIEEWRQEEAKRSQKRLREVEQRRVQSIENITPHKTDVESGKAAGILEYYSRIWRGMFTDVSNEIPSEERLKEEVGPEWCQIITTGIRNSVNYPENFHSMYEIADQSAKNSHYYRAYLMCTAMDLIEKEGKEAVLGLSDEVLKLAVAYSMSPSSINEPEWLKWIWESKRELAWKTALKYWLRELKAGAERLTGFYEFNGDELLCKGLPEILPIVLKFYPNLSTDLLKTTLINLFKFVDMNVQATVVERALKKNHASEGRITLWLAAGYRVAPNSYFQKLKARLSKCDGDKWFARDILRPYFWEQDQDGSLKLKLENRQEIIELLAVHFKNIGHDRNRSARWIGSHDEPSAADEIRRMISSFAQEASDCAALALDRLSQNPKLIEWSVDIRFASIGQLRTAREAKFTYPYVSQVVSTLSNLEPANPSDLKALVLDGLKEISEEIRHGNTDGYKAFWNLDNGKATDEHVNENTARDRILEYLRSKTKHLDIVSEPEAQYADEKRSDIAVYSKGMKLPIEIKRDDHAEVWSAAENQLERLYTRDPASEGNGIYLVFWFDGDFKKQPPNTLSKPESAKQMREALETLMPESSSGLIDVVVIDVSVPEEKRAKRKPRN